MADFFLTPRGSFRGADLEACFSPGDGSLAVSERLASGEIAVHCFDSDTGARLLSRVMPGAGPRPFWGSEGLLWIAPQQRGDRCLRLVALRLPSGEPEAEARLDVAAARHVIEGVHRAGTHCQVVSHGDPRGALYSVLDLARGEALWSRPWDDIFGPSRSKGGTRLGPFADDGSTLVYARSAGRVAHLDTLDGRALREVDRRDRKRTLAVAWASPDVVALISQEPAPPHESLLRMIDLRTGHAVLVEPLHRKEDGWVMQGVDAQLSPDGARWLLLWNGARRGEVLVDLRARTLRRLPEDIGTFHWMGSSGLFTGRSPWATGRFEIVRRAVDGRPLSRGHYRSAGFGPGFHGGSWDASPCGGFFFVAEREGSDPRFATMAWFSSSSLLPGDEGHTTLRR